ncbi:MAG TPA: sulfite exporter TauE/SafE family protein [Burkholderiaceae bacterium]|nr:sulfite exporter TauE/SafE family protein [Burkholderiaceae bacterium]
MPDLPLIGWLLLLGGFTGLAAGLLGIGGGMLMVPFLTMLLTARDFPLDIVVKVAIATSLTTILFTSLSSVRAHARRGAVRWDIAKTLAPGIVIGSLLGAQVAALMPGRLLAVAFGVFVSLMATRMLVAQASQADRVLPGARGMAGMGALIGALSALVGAGGGFITVPFLTRANVRIHEAVATSAACGFPIALAGATGYVVAGWNQALPAGTVGFVYIPALLAIVASSVLTAPLGVKVAHALSVSRLRQVFAGLLYALAAYMLWKGLAGG